MDAKVRRRCVSDADGEVVWSWSPDAGINPRVKSPGGRRLTSPVLRREREVSRKPLRRECRMFRPACTDLWAPFLFSPQGLRVRPAPGIPCALRLRERHLDATPGRKSRRGNAEACLLTPSSFRGAATCRRSAQRVGGSGEPGIHNPRRLLLEAILTGSQTQGCGYDSGSACGLPRNDEASHASSVVEQRADYL